MRQTEGRLFGIQTWVALLKQYEEVAPAFVHYGAAEFPEVGEAGLRVRVIAGAMFGVRLPVHTYSDLFYAEVCMTQGSSISVPAEHVERAAFLVEGAVKPHAEDHRVKSGQLLVFKPKDDIVLPALSLPVRSMLLGGEPLDGLRHVWWNFVSSSSERIEQAKADWKAGRFKAVPGETEFIPSPE